MERLLDELIGDKRITRVYLPSGTLLLPRSVCRSSGCSGRDDVASLCGPST